LDRFILAHDVSRCVDTLKHALRLRFARHAGTRRRGLDGWRLWRETEYAVCPFGTKLIRVPRATPAHARSKLRSKTFGSWAERALSCNQSINQSIMRQSINQSPRPGPSIYLAFPRPCSAILQERCHGCCLSAHVSPTLHKHMENMGGGGPHTRCPASCSMDSCIDGIPGTPAARQSRSDASQIYEKRKVNVLLVSNPPSPRPQVSIRIQMLPGHLHNASLSAARCDDA
jgi:hypothetical protein